MAISTDLDRVRLMVGDTDVTDQLLSDDEINAFIDYNQIDVPSSDTDATNLPAAAADAAGAIAGKFSRRFNFAEDGQRFDLAQRVTHYMTLEKTLRARSGGSSVAVLDTET